MGSARSPRVPAVQASNSDHDLAASRKVTAWLPSARPHQAWRTSSPVHGRCGPLTARGYYPAGTCHCRYLASATRRTRSGPLAGHCAQQLPAVRPLHCQHTVVDRPLDLELSIQSIPATAGLEGVAPQAVSASALQQLPVICCLLLIVVALKLHARTASFSRASLPNPTARPDSAHLLDYHSIESNYHTQLDRSRPRLDRRPRAIVEPTRMLSRHKPQR